MEAPRAVKPTLVPPDWGEPLPRSFYERPATAVAADLLGHVLVHAAPDGMGAGVVVEAEAYGADDPASHAFGGPTPRNAAMFGRAGRAYVYRSYGVHWCMNVVTGNEGVGEAVLLRALEPIAGLEAMRRRRPGALDRDLCRGPGRLTAALGITGALDRCELTEGGVWICGAHVRTGEVLARPRIGVTRGADRLWRFCLSGSRLLSRR